jgi:type I restriction enzyme S subunit
MLMSDDARAPEGWSVEPLSKCVEVLDSKRKPVNSKERAARVGSIPYYGATGQVGWIDNYLFDEELVLVGEDGAPFFDKSKPIAYVISGKAWVNNHAHVLRARKDVTSNRYVKHYLDSFDFTAYVQGSTRDKLTQGAMNSIPVLLAPLDQQAAISFLIDATEVKRNSAARHLALARLAIERFRQVVLAAACSGRLTSDLREDNRRLTADEAVDFARSRRQEQLGRRYREPDLNNHVGTLELPIEWQLAPLGLLLEDVKYGTSKRSEYEAVGIPVLRIPNVSRGRLDLSDLKYGDLDAREAESLALRTGDLLMVRSNGSVHLVGKAALVTEDAVGLAYAGYLMRLRTDQEVLVPQYLGLVLAAPQLRLQVELPARSTSGVHNINTDEVRGLGIPLPSVDEQREIVRRVNELFARSDDVLGRVSAASARVDRCSQAVLAKGFRGELTTAAAG